MLSNLCNWSELQDLSLNDKHCIIAINMKKEERAMTIKNKKEFKQAINNFSFRYAKTYTNKAPHEYVVVEDDSKEIELIRELNKFIQENPDEIEIFWNKEYPVLFVEEHKYWTIEDYSVTNILNRNWDYRNEDGTINKSITESYMGK